MVGAIPVGIETKGNVDVPYWPNGICWTYKEVWTQPAGEWIWLMRDLSGPAVLNGVVDPGSTGAVTLQNERTHAMLTAAIDGNGSFRAALPQGHYRITYGDARTSLTALAGGTYSVDLRRNHAVAFSAFSESGSIPDRSLCVRLPTERANTHFLCAPTTWTSQTPRQFP